MSKSKFILRSKAKINSQPNVNVADCLRYQYNCCFYCFIRFKDENDYTKDHLFPKADGHSITNNMVIACKKCNNKKGSRHPSRREIIRAYRLIYMHNNAESFICKMVNGFPVKRNNVTPVTIYHFDENGKLKTKTPREIRNES